MAPRKKVRLCHSQMTYSAKYERISPRRGSFPHRDCSESVLHRLRPRTKHAAGASETMYVKKQARRTRRKRTLLLVKRCFTRRKRRRRNLSRKSTEGGQILPSNVADGNRKPASFLRAIRDYVACTFREGTRWAAECVFRAFGFVGKSQCGFWAPRRGGDAASSVSRTVQGAQSDLNRERARRRGPRNLNSHQGDGGGFPEGVWGRDCPVNSYGKKTVGLTTSGEKDQRRFNRTNFTGMRVASEIAGKVFRKRGKLRSPYPSRRKRRRKRNRLWSKRTPRNNSRFDEKVGKIVRDERNYRDVRESRALTSLAKPLDHDASKKNEPNEGRCPNRIENSDENTQFSQVITLDEKCVAKSGDKMKFEESSRGDQSSSQNTIENN